LRQEIFTGKLLPINSLKISMGKIGKAFLLFLAFVLTISTIISINPLVDAQFTYGGNSNTNNPPSIIFSIENNTTLYNLGNYNIAFLISVGADPNSLAGPTALHSVSYKASWQKQPQEIHKWSMNDPTNMEDDDPDPKSVFFYAIDLTNVPQGSHQIKVTVTGGGYVFGGSLEYYTFTTNGSSTLNFSVIAPPSPTTSPTPANSSSAWDIQTLDIRGAGAYIYNSPLIVLDSNDMPHIVYSKFIDWPNSFTRFVMYESWNGLGWSTQAISTGTPYSFVLDDNNTPHLVYGCIDYATFNGTTWVTQNIENVGDNFGAVALDSSGKPHVAYTDGKTVKYASQTGSSWDIQIIESLNPEYNVPFQVSLTLDQNDTVYVLYGYPSSYEDENTNMSYSTTTIRLAVCKDSRWSIETVSLPPPVNGYGNLVLDSKGYPHFICSQRQLPSTYPDRSNLLYVSWDGAAWNTENVVSNVTLGIGGGGENVNWVNMGFLALDSNDYPKISYVDTQLMYVSWTGKTWNIQPIDTNAQAIKPGFVALDSNDNPHISYLGSRYYAGRLYQAYANITYATTTEIVVAIVSPENKPYNEDSVSLNFTVNKRTSWIGYSLDGQENVAITGNTTLRGVTNGGHNVTVYVKDLFGNNGTSETIYFSVEAPFPTLLIVAPAASAIVVGIILAIYFKKRKH
jgi:hypothetical protein